MFLCDIEYNEGMKKALNIFFVVLGVIFFMILIVGAVYLAVLSLGSSSSPFGASSNGEAQSMNEGDSHPLLSPAQEAALQGFGIDPASVPSEISPEQEACFVEALGQERVDEIKGGATPNASDYFKAKGCI